MMTPSPATRQRCSIVVPALRLVRPEPPPSTTRTRPAPSSPGRLQRQNVVTASADAHDPSNAERFPNWRNCVEQLLVMLSFLVRNADQLLASSGSLLAWIGFLRLKVASASETRDDACAPGSCRNAAQLGCPGFCDCHQDDEDGDQRARWNQGGRKQAGRRYASRAGPRYRGRLDHVEAASLAVLRDIVLEAPCAPAPWRLHQGRVSTSARISSSAGSDAAARMVV